MPAPYGCWPSHHTGGSGSHLDHYGCGYLFTLLGCHLFGFAPLKHLRENIRKLRDRERRSLFHNQSPIFDFPSGVLLRVHGWKLHDPAGPRKGIGFSGRGPQHPHEDQSAFHAPTVSPLVSLAVSVQLSPASSQT